MNPSAAPVIRSLAVLPLANLSGDPSQDFFSDGMTAELIHEVSKIAQLRVVSRTSVMSYKGTHKALPQVARDLNVNTLLEGSVARSGDHVRVAVGLYDGASERESWSGTFRSGPERRSRSRRRSRACGGAADPAKNSFLTGNAPQRQSKAYDPT